MIDIKAVPFNLDDEGVKWVEETKKAMTLEEKIGQMTELAIDVLGGLSMENSSLTKLNCARPLQNIKVGSFLNAPGPVAQDKDKWQEIIGTIQSMSMKRK